MNRSELGQVIATAGCLPKQVAERVLDAALQAIARELVEGGKVTLSGFGSFRVVARKARNGRDARSGQRIAIAARNSVLFGLSPELKVALNPEALAAQLPAEPARARAAAL